MNIIPIHSKNYVMPAWVTIKEAVNIINDNIKNNITDSDIWRYALYGHLPVSIYFQSPVILRRVITVKNKLLLMKVMNDPVNRLCYLNSESLLKKSDWIVKTEGEYFPLPGNVMDTPLLGYECAELQILLARSLKIPPPEKGIYNIYCGFLVCDNKHIYQAFEYINMDVRITQQLQKLPENIVDLYRQNLEASELDRLCHDYFPVYYFPGDACFVVKLTCLKKFINTFFSDSSEITSKISTPVARFLWLACKHNDAIRDITDNPYKLVSVFEQWAIADGITDRLSGDTLKKALKRGAPV